jgi:hypothetical protein
LSTQNSAKSIFLLHDEAIPVRALTAGRILFRNDLIYAFVNGEAEPV